MCFAGQGLSDLALTASTVKLKCELSFINKMSTPASNRLTSLLHLIVKFSYKHLFFLLCCPAWDKCPVNICKATSSSSFTCLLKMQYNWCLQKKSVAIHPMSCWDNSLPRWWKIVSFLSCLPVSISSFLSYWLKAPCSRYSFFWDCTVI